MNIIRDVLDNQLVDRQGRPIGRVDGIIAVGEVGAQPRVAFIEVGVPTALRRINRALGDLAERWLTRFGPDGPAVRRVPWNAIKDVGIDVDLDIDADEQKMLAWEHWARDKLVARVPLMR
jgi:hypothetical protein